MESDNESEEENASVPHGTVHMVREPGGEWIIHILGEDSDHEPFQDNDEAEANEDHEDELNSTNDEIEIARRNGENNASPRESRSPSPNLDDLDTEEIQNADAVEHFALPEPISRELIRIIGDNIVAMDGTQPIELDWRKPAAFLNNVRVHIQEYFENNQDKDLVYTRFVNPTMLYSMISLSPPLFVSEEVDLKTPIANLEYGVRDQKDLNDIFASEPEFMAFYNHLFQGRYGLSFYLFKQTLMRDSVARRRVYARINPLTIYKFYPDLLDSLFGIENEEKQLKRQQFMKEDTLLCNVKEFFTPESDPEERAFFEAGCDFLLNDPNQDQTFKMPLTSRIHFLTMEHDGALYMPVFEKVPAWEKLFVKHIRLEVFDVKALKDILPRLYFELEPMTNDKLYGKFYSMCSFKVSRLPRLEMGRYSIVADLKHMRYLYSRIQWSKYGVLQHMYGTLYGEKSPTVRKFLRLDVYDTFYNLVFHNPPLILLPKSNHFRLDLRKPTFGAITSPRVDPFGPKAVEFHILAQKKQPEVTVKLRDSRRIFHIQNKRWVTFFFDVVRRVYRMRTTVPDDRVTEVITSPASTFHWVSRLAIEPDVNAYLRYRLEVRPEKLEEFKYFIRTRKSVFRLHHPTLVSMDRPCRAFMQQLALGNEETIRNTYNNTFLPALFALGKKDSIVLALDFFTRFVLTYFIGVPFYLNWTSSLSFI